MESKKVKFNLARKDGPGIDKLMLTYSKLGLSSKFNMVNKMISSLLVEVKNEGKGSELGADNFQEEVSLISTEYMDNWVGTINEIFIKIVELKQKYQKLEKQKTMAINAYAKKNKLKRRENRDPKVIGGFGDCQKEFSFDNKGTVLSLSSTNIGSSTILASGHNNGKVTIWEVNTGKKLKTIKAHESAVLCLLTYREEGKLNSNFLATGGFDNLIKIWSVEVLLTTETSKYFTLPPSKNLTGHTQDVNHIMNISELWDKKSRVNLENTSSKTILCSSSVDSEIRIWDVEAEECIKIVVAHYDSVLSMTKISMNKMEMPDYIVSSSWDATMKVWDLSNFECLGTLTSHSEAVNSVINLSDFNTSDKIKIASGSTDATIKIWELPYSISEMTDALNDSEACCVLTLTGHTDSINKILRLDFQNKILIVSASIDHSIRIWDSENGELIKILHGHLNSVESIEVVNMKLIIDNNEESHLMIASGSIDTTIKLWNCELWKYSFQMSFYITTLISFKCGEDFYIVAGCSNNMIKVWEGKDFSKCVATLHEHRGAISSLIDLGAVNGQHTRMIASASWDCKIKLWEISSKKSLRTLSGHTEMIKCLLRRVDYPEQIVSGAQDNLIKIWDMGRGECVKTLSGHQREVNCLINLKIGEKFILASGSFDGTIKLWSVDKEECIYTILTTGIEQNLGNQNSVESLLEISDLFTSEAIDKENTLPNNPYIACGMWEGKIKIWQIISELVDGAESISSKKFKTLSGHESNTCVLSTISFFRRKLLISGGSDKTIRFWDIKTGICSKVIEAHSDTVRCLLHMWVDNDQQLILISGSEDLTVKIWTVEYALKMQVAKGYNNFVYQFPSSRAGISS